jgi:hypothetical protein
MGNRGATESWGYVIDLQAIELVIWLREKRLVWQITRSQGLMPQFASWEKGLRMTHQIERLRLEM